MRPWMLIGCVFLAACEGPDEVTCELEANGASVCVDLNSQSYCERDWDGTATNAEVEPGGPYRYCEDVYAIRCEGLLTIEGGASSTSYAFYANSEEDCTAAAGTTIVSRVRPGAE